jgi:hypothetical protein
MGSWSGKTTSLTSSNKDQGFMRSKCEPPQKRAQLVCETGLFIHRFFSIYWLVFKLLISFSIYWFILFSYNLIPIKLERFVDTFELKIPGTEGKQFFPYRFNKVWFDYINFTYNYIPGRKYWCCTGPLAFKKELLRRRDDAEEKETIW